jgi:hypothetical protein
MEKPNNNFKFLIDRISKTVWMILSVILIFGIIAATAVIYFNKDNSISISENDKISITPTQIRSIENIGEWEFLSVSDEELVDTVRRGFFGDDELVRIYYGTLRLGINLHEAKPGWIKTEGDSISVMLPPIKLLDGDFIDEARTRSFYESGDWAGKDRDALYRRAYKIMKARCLNEQNVNSAQDNACKQFYTMMRSMGFENVRIRFDMSQTQK